MSKELSDPQEIFKSENKLLANNLRKLVHKTINKANDIVSQTEDMEELSKAIKIAEIAGKISGIVQEKNQINMQINQISGFTFIEIDKPDTIQYSSNSNELDSQEIEINEQDKITE